MERFVHLLLDVWRESCRHIEIGESVARIAPLLVRRIPVDLLLVRRFDLAKPAIDTVAAGSCRGTPLPKDVHTECTLAELDRLIAWSRGAPILREQAFSIADRLPRLLPAGVDGHVLAGPLNWETQPAGVLIFVADPIRSFRQEHEALMTALLEPFAVALENDRRLHELTRLREAVEADNQSLLTRLGRRKLVDTVVGAETGLRDVMERVGQVSQSDVPVLLLGETGSGKEVVARAIHNGSRRSAGPFLRVNCGAIPPELIDSELFGHERGSFTGAVADRKGWFERADGGTLFLDEVGELPPAAQVRLLRVLQDGSFERVGGERPLHVDVRVIAATNRDVHAMVADGRFREDLWYRLAVFVVRIPPVRERIQDIPGLAAHFAQRAAKRFGMPPLVPTAEDNALLAAYPWPGNVRELAAVIERAAILGNGRRLEVAKALGVGASPAVPPRAIAKVEPAVGGAPPVQQRFLTLDEAMSRYIEAALARTQGRVEGPHGAARLLDINPHTLRARMRKLGVKWQEYRRTDLPA